MLRRLLKYEGVRTVVMLAQPRKRAQGEPNGRRFDDLFGSRVWKGRSSVVLFPSRWMTARAPCLVVPPASSRSRVRAPVECFVVSVFARIMSTASRSDR
jgi:hypothetical protein